MSTSSSPLHPHKLKQIHQQSALHRRKSFARFFSKQLLLFVGFTFIILVVDFFLYTGVAIQESNEYVNPSTPTSLTRKVDEALTKSATDEHAYQLSDAAVNALGEAGAWSALINDEGQVVWSQNMPDDVPKQYTINDTAMAAHYANISDYPTFFYDRDDGLLVVGFPKGSYWHMGFTFPTESVARMPLYVMLIFVVDAALLFLLYAFTKRRTQNAVGPLADALDQLAQGQTTDVHLKGDLKEVGERIGEVSQLIQQKDTARGNWIRGVSHDIRTPLSLILVNADNIAEDEHASAELREQAAIIRTQGLRIRDLVTDLNTASRLDYDMQPLHLERVHLARLLREIAAAHINSGLAEKYPLLLDVAPNATDAVVLADERLLTRAVENAVTNARIHNEEGCSITLSLSCERAVVITITDEGRGVTPAQLVRLQVRLAQARLAQAPLSASYEDTEHGLGLVLIDRIARAHGGFLTIDANRTNPLDTDTNLTDASLTDTNLTDTNTTDRSGFCVRITLPQPE